jgi:hypothetical protein
MKQGWDDFARVAGSLKRGYVTASLLVSRLQAYPRQGHLTKLLQEYGRLVKTIFILRYLEDAALRHRIRTQLNKGEKLHALRAEGYPVREEDLGHLWPTRFAHVHRYGKYTFNIEAARTRTGLRPLAR